MTTNATIHPKHPAQLVGSLALAELRVFVRQPVLIGLALLLPAGLLVITAIAETSDVPAAWAQIAGRNVVATQCITVYFVALNTLTARRHTLALKRLRTTALPSVAIVAGLLVPPLIVGAFQVATILAGLVLMGSPEPQSPGLVMVASAVGMVIAALAGVVTSALTATPEKAQWTMLPLFVAAMGATAILPSIDHEAGAFALGLLPLVANADLATAGWWMSSPDMRRVAVDFAVMTVWVALLSVLSWRTFRWERRH